MGYSGTYLLIGICFAVYFYTTKKKAKSTVKTVKPRTIATPKSKAKKPKIKESNKATKKEKNNDGIVAQLGTIQNSSNLNAKISQESKGRDEFKGLEAIKANNTNIGLSDFDLEKEINQLQERTGWDYQTAKVYCEKAVEYRQKIKVPTRLKN